MAEDEFLPIYEEMNRRNGIIFYHPCGNGICSPMITDYGFSAAVGTSLEDAVIALHLIAKKIPAKYPNITYVIPHLGGLVPMLLQRLDNQFSMQAARPAGAAQRHGAPLLLRHGRPRLARGAAPAPSGVRRRPRPARQRLPGAAVMGDLRPRPSRGSARPGLPEADVEQILERTAPAVLQLG